MVFIAHIQQGYIFEYQPEIKIGPRAVFDTELIYTRIWDCMLRAK